MDMHDIIVVGGSAGALEGLTVLLEDLPQTLRASVCAVLHASESGLAYLPSLLQRRTRMKIRIAADGDPVRRGTVFLPPPDHHLLLRPGRTIVNRGPKQNRFRPAIDPLFVSAAAAYGPRVVGVLLSGLLDDGVHGLADIQKNGGVTVVQHPEDAPIPILPENALRAMRIDHVVPAAGMGRLLQEISRTPSRKAAAGRKKRTAERETRLLGPGPTRIPRSSPSPFTCPECDGALWMTSEAPTMLRCHVGHAFTPSSLLAGQREVGDQRLWGAVRSLEEQAEMHRRFVPAAVPAARRRDFQRHAEALERRALVLRRILVEASPSTRHAAKPRPHETRRAAGRRAS
jgi:two-component system chemotaxis response regulator CheB